MRYKLKELKVQILASRLHICCYNPFAAGPESISCSEFSSNSGSTGLGTSGEVLHCISAQLTPSKNGCCFISADGVSGNNLSCRPTTLNNDAMLLEPLKGVFPERSSWRKIPKIHQSTALPCSSPLMISGAKYPWVPTKDIDQAVVGSTTSSGSTATCCLGVSAHGFLVFFLFYWGKSLGTKHAG